MWSRRPCLSRAVSSCWASASQVSRVAAGAAGKWRTENLGKFTLSLHSLHSLFLLPSSGPPLDAPRSFVRRHGIAWIPRSFHSNLIALPAKERDYDPLPASVLPGAAQTAFRTGGKRMGQGACRAVEAPGRQDDESRRLLGRPDATQGRGALAVLEACAQGRRPG